MQLRPDHAHVATAGYACVEGLETTFAREKMARLTDFAVKVTKAAGPQAPTWSGLEERPSAAHE